jgi:hypothetical protein
MPVLVAAFALACGSGYAQTKQHAHENHATAAASAAAEAQQTAGTGFGVTESLTGTLQMVVADQDVIVVTGPNNVPYDLKITPKTVIVVGEKRGTIETLSNEVGKPVSVGFVPQRDGNYANRLEVAG